VYPQASDCRVCSPVDMGLTECAAVTPEEAAVSLVEWTEALDLSKTGEYWAPRGPRDIGTAEPVLGKGLPTPMKLPW
jgi:hypothetical protein